MCDTVPLFSLKESRSSSPFKNNDSSFALSNQKNLNNQQLASGAKQIEYKKGNQMDLVATFAKTAVLFEVPNTQHAYLPSLWDLVRFTIP